MSTSLSKVPQFSPQSSPQLVELSVTAAAYICGFDAVARFVSVAAPSPLSPWARRRRRRMRTCAPAPSVTAAAIEDFAAAVG